MLLLNSALNTSPNSGIWTISRIVESAAVSEKASRRSVERGLLEANWLPTAVGFDQIHDEHNRPLKKLVANQMLSQSRQKRWLNIIVYWHHAPAGLVLASNDGRSGRRWCFVDSTAARDIDMFATSLASLARHTNKRVLFWPHGEICHLARLLHTYQVDSDYELALAAYQPSLPTYQSRQAHPSAQPSTNRETL